jgi:hypothetical protein
MPEVICADLTGGPVSGERSRHDLTAIAMRAYQLAERHGFAPGHELHDWLQAEREMQGSGE